MKNLCILIIYIIVFATSCAKKEESDDSSDTTTASGANGTYEGTWSKACTQNDSNYDIKSYIITGTSFKVRTASHSDSSCTTDSHTIDMTTTLTIGESIEVKKFIDNSTTTADKIDYTLTTIEVTPESDSIATGWNSSSFCGFSDWVSGSTKDISADTSCLSGAPSIGHKGKDIFKVIGTDLWEGHGSSSMKDSDGYPTHLQDSNHDKK